MESLRPNRELLDPKFEGYKLALDPLTLSSTSLASAVNNVPLREESFSFQHIRAFGNRNHLVIDSWTDCGKTEVVYFVNENYEVQRVFVKVSQLIIKIVKYNEKIERQKLTVSLKVARTFICYQMKREAFCQFPFMWSRRI